MKSQVRIILLLGVFLVQAFAAYAAGVGSIHGSVTDGGRPVVGATVRLLELDRVVQTDGVGGFTFPDVPVGTYKIFVRCIGYTSATQTVKVEEGIASMTFAMKQSAIQGEKVIVSATPEARTTSEQYQSVDSKSGTELHQSAGASFSEEIGDIPGVAVRWNGSGPTRPILRGLSDNEVLVLENGLRTADLATFDPAHATPIESESINEVDIVRGPASIVFGPNAIGGLVNVITNIVPTAAGTDGFSGRASVTGNSVSNLYSGYFNGVYTNGGHAFSISAGGTHSDAIKIPNGTYTDPANPSGSPGTYTLDTIPNSFVHTEEEGIGYSYTGDWGMIGVGGKHYKSDYGIPGDPVDTIVRFPSTSRIAQEKYTVELRGLFNMDGSFIKQIRLNANAVDYLHSEYPVAEDPVTLAVSDDIQNSFHQNGYNTTLQFIQQRMGDWEGTMGLYSNFVNMSLGGPQPLGPGSLTTDLAGYIYEEFLASENTRIQGAVRFDYDKIQTNPDPSSMVPAFQTFDTSRTESAFTGSLGLVQKLSSDMTLSLSVARSFRPPTVQELFGNGPDDASASFIVGNSSLSPESGVGFDAILTGRFENFSFSVSPFLNLINNYIYSYELGPVDSGSGYQFRNFAQTNARLFGFEASTTVQLMKDWAVTANVDYVNATDLSDSSRPLPFTPPMKGLVRLNYQDETFAGMLEWRLTAPQNRVGLGEDSTKGYGLVNIGFGVRLPTGGAVHEISLHCDNLFDQRYYDHLSLIQGFLPMPGRAFRLTYDVVF